MANLGNAKTMIVEYSFISQANNKCYLALCAEPIDTIKDVANKYWQSHGIENDSWSKFEFHRNKDNEYVVLVACTEINAYALEFALANFESLLGQRCQMPDLLRIIRDFDKKMSS
mgnify:CR=1 FL=1